MPVAKPPVPLVFVGEPQAIELLMPPAVFCQNGNPRSTGVTTDLVDPQNQAISHTHTEPTSSDTKGYSTTVSFTPTTPGVYHLSARFEPALGLVQREVQVVLDRSMEAPALRMRISSACDEVFPLRDAVLCRRGTQLSVLRDGGTELTEPIVGLTSSAGVAWWWSASQLTRAEDVDGGLTRVDLALALPVGATSVQADQFLRAGSSLLEVTFVDGGLSLRDWGFPIAAVGPGLARAGSVVGFATATQLCTAAEDASVFCIDSPLTPGVGEGNVLWLRGDSKGTVGLARFSDAVQEPAVLFLPAQSVSLTDTKLPVPYFTWSGRVVTVRASDLTLEAWKSPGTVMRQTVTTEHVLFQLTTGELVVYRR